MIEKLEDKKGMFSFVIKAKNGEILVISQKYHSESARDNAIDSLFRVVSNLITQ